MIVGLATDAGSTDEATEGSEDLRSGEATASPDRSGGDENEPIQLEISPPRLSQLIAIGAAIIGAFLTAPFATLAIPFGLAGLVIIVTSLTRVYSRRWLSIGAALVLAGTLIAGSYGSISSEIMLIGVGAVIFAWDTGQHGIGIGKQLGRETHSRRIQLVHASTSAIAIGLIGSLSYIVSIFAGGNRPAPAVSLIVLGIIVMAWMYRQ